MLGRSLAAAGSVAAGGGAYYYYRQEQANKSLPNPETKRSNDPQVDAAVRIGERIIRSQTFASLSNIDTANHPGEVQSRAVKPVGKPPGVPYVHLMTTSLSR